MTKVTIEELIQDFEDRMAGRATAWDHIKKYALDIEPSQTAYNHDWLKEVQGDPESGGWGDPEPPM